MKRAGLFLSLLTVVVAPVSSAAECYFGEVRAPKLTDGGTVLEVIAYFPCSNGDQEDVPFWVEDLGDGKIGVAIEIPGLTCAIGRRFEKKIRYNVAAYHLDMPSQAFLPGNLKSLEYAEYADAKSHLGVVPCTETKSIGFGNGAVR